MTAHRPPTVIVIGGGHAGIEAAVAAAAVLRAHGADLSEGASGGRVVMVTMDPSRIGTMSCNPAIGGLAKGQMVREIDALGGVMGQAADRAGIMFKMLNASKGPAVRGPRAQCDKYAYAAAAQELLAERGAGVNDGVRIEVRAGTVERLLVEGGRIRGVAIVGGAGVDVDPRARERNARRVEELASGDAEKREHGAFEPIFVAERRTFRGDDEIVLEADAVVLTTGTFMRALMHMGESATPGGRVGEGAAVGISAALRAIGIELGRQKTGTPPRLRRGSIDWDELEPQHGDETPVPFSIMSRDAGPFPTLPQHACRISATTAEMHRIIRANLHRAPMYAGRMEATCGPRYCPSIEDKVVRFADRDRHHVFLEPESLHTDEVYCNGISTSLPEEIQRELVRLMPGCAHAEIIRAGYAVEYDMVWPNQLRASGMVRAVHGLFLAGQINGTSGYEEAAAQGLVAGLNAARLAVDQEAVTFARDEAYLGVLMDDLVTCDPREPYRMFTSRAEHRLLLRADNAEERLTRRGRALGLVGDAQWRAFGRRGTAAERVGSILQQRVDGETVADRARRPGTPLATLETIVESALRRDGVECTRHEREALGRAVTDLRYEGFVTRAAAEVRRQEQASGMRLPDWLDPHAILGLRAEAAHELARFHPETLGQAARLAGVSPADITLIAIAIRRGQGASRAAQAQS